MRECYIGVEGGKAFAEALPKSSLTSLECAAAHVLAFCVQRPMTFLRPHDTFPVLGSLYGNELGSEGGKAVANVLPQTKLTSLKCAFPQLTPLASCSAPLSVCLLTAQHRWPSAAD